MQSKNNLKGPTTCGNSDIHKIPKVIGWKSDIFYQLARRPINAPVEFSP